MFSLNVRSHGPLLWWNGVQISHYFLPSVSLHGAHLIMGPPGSTKTDSDLITPKSYCKVISRTRHSASTDATLNGLEVWPFFKNNTTNDNFFSYIFRYSNPVAKIFNTQDSMAYNYFRMMWNGPQGFKPVSTLKFANISIIFLPRYYFKNDLINDNTSMWCDFIQILKWHVKSLQS